MKKSTVSTVTIQESKAGNPAAFDTIMRAFEKPVRGFISKMINNPDDAAELTQETFLRAYKGIATYDTSRPFSTWLFSIAKYTTFAHLKKHRHHAYTLDIDGEERSDTILYEATQQQDIEAALLKKIDVETELTALRTPYKRVLILLYWHEYSYKQIARVLHLPLNTVKTHIRRARHAFAHQWRRHTQHGASL